MNTIDFASSPLGNTSDVVGEVGQVLNNQLIQQTEIQNMYLAYSTEVEAIRVISEMVQKSIDISENERQDISQAQE